uniref:solute carrier family 17 member 9 isoform X1 n=1 Tax=Macaca mulatta TaxID=9544 RepID=UPI0010A28BD8|nr:solute carrier family 17 member 9 isoform X1 [Macaca mulatta]
MQPTPDEARRDRAGDSQWSRPECQAWTGTLLLGTCLLYCARSSMPICTVSMSQDFGWNKKEAGIVLSSFFWGYCLTQVVGGHLGDRIGGEKVILLSASAWGSITAVTPLLAQLSSAHLAFMTFSRILMGLLQGVYFPALTSLLSQKVRDSERAFTYSTVGAGSQFGTLLTGAVGSLLLEWYGWQSVFYFSGGLTLLWVWYVYRYLLSGKDLVLALGVLAQGLPVSRHNRVPWRRLFRKPAVWAAVISQLSAACSFFVLISWLPTFFKETFPDAKGWIFNVVPWLVAIPASLFSGFLSDHLINQGYTAVPPLQVTRPSLPCRLHGRPSPAGYTAVPPLQVTRPSLPCRLHGRPSPVGYTAVPPLQVTEPSRCGSSCRAWALASQASLLCAWATPPASVSLWCLHQPPSASRPSTTVAFPLTSRTWPRPAPAFCLVWPTQLGPWQVSWVCVWAAT